jgi:hypothetical protein
MHRWEGDGLSSSPRCPVGSGGVGHRGHDVLSPAQGIWVSPQEGPHQGLLPPSAWYVHVECHEPFL